MSKPTLSEVIQSVLAAFIGVQSNENRQRDFSQSSVMTYIIVGLVATLVFVLSIVFVVSLIT